MCDKVCLMVHGFSNLSLGIKHNFSSELFQISFGNSKSESDIQKTSINIEDQFKNISDFLNETLVLKCQKICQLPVVLA